MGLSVSAVLNIIVGFSSSFVLIALLWAFNGFFLSILWGPMVKTFSYWYPKEEQTKIAVGISTSMIGGFLDFTSYMGAALAGVLTGYMVDNLGWASVVLLWLGLVVLGIISVIISEKSEEKLT